MNEQTLRERVVAGIRGDIVSGHLEPGAVYSAPYLADIYHVSVTPVREALLDLVKEGLLEPVRNKGFRVLEPSDQDHDEIAQLRDLLEPPTAGLVARIATETQIAHLRNLASDIERYAIANDVAKYVEADRNFHLAVIEITGNKRLLEAVSTLRSQARLFGLQRIADKGGLQSSSEEHNQLMNAIERHDSTRAEEIMREHLGHIRKEWS